MTDFSLKSRFDCAINMNAVDFWIWALITVQVVHELIGPPPAITVLVHHEEHPQGSYQRVSVSGDDRCSVARIAGMYLQSFWPLWVWAPWQNFTLQGRVADPFQCIDVFCENANQGFFFDTLLKLEANPVLWVRNKMELTQTSLEL